MTDTTTYRNAITRRSLGALTLGACASGLAAPALAASASPMRIAWLPGTCGRLYAAEAFHLFKKAGLNAKLVRFDTGPAMNAAFQAKSVDVGYSGLPGLLVALAAGVPMELFLVENNADRADGLVVAPNSNISKVSDLRGKRVGTIIGTTAWMGLITALKKAGVNDSDVHIVNLPLSTIVPAYKRHEVDAVWIWAPWLFDLQKMGGKVIARDTNGFNANAWFGRTDYLNKHKPEVIRFLKALDLGTQKLRSNPHQVAAFMSQQMGIKLAATEELLSSVSFPTYKEQMKQSFSLSMTNPNGGISAILAKYAHVFQQHGIIRHVPSLKGVVQPRFVESYLHESR